ncbi:MAG: spore cortex biosynthesis protein YabQ [Chloroflexota bacterium]
MLTLDLQLYAVLVMFLTGVALGLVFDIYRGVRAALDPGPLVTGIGDFLFWVIGTLIMIVALLCGTWGEVRLFVPISVAVGLAVYRGLTGRLVARGTDRLLRLIARALRVICGWVRTAARAVLTALIAVLNVLLWPLRLVTRLFDRPRRWAGRQLSRALAPVARLRRRIVEALRILRDGPPPPPPDA